MRRQLLQVSVLATSLLVVALTAVAVAGATPAWVVEQLVTAGTTAAQRAPSHGQSGLAWEDDRGGDWDVYLDTGSYGLPAAAIPAPAGDQRRPSVSPDSPWIAYEDARNGNWDIYAYNTSTGLEVRVSTGSADQLDPAVSGARVVFEDRQGGGSDIRVFDLVKKTSALLAKGSALQVDPAIEGSVVAWADNGAGNWDVVVTTLGRTTPKHVTTNRSAQTSPCVEGRRVAYVDGRNGDPDIYLYSLATGEERRITTNPYAQTVPAISGDWIVYQDGRNGTADIYGTHLVAGVEKRFTDHSSAQQTPVAWHSAEYGRIAWQDERAGDTDIYFAGFRTPYLRVNDPDHATVSYNGSTSVFCELQADDSFIPAALVWKYDWRNGRAFKTSVSADVSDTTGSLKLEHLLRKATFRVVFRGDDRYVPVASPVLDVEVGASIRGVEFHATHLTGAVRYVRITGTILPRHRAGSSVARVQLLKRQRDGSYRVQAGARAKAADRSAGASTFVTGTMKIPPGRYKVRVTHDDTDHALTVYEPPWERLQF